MSKYEIEYPSGMQFSLSGDFLLAPLDNWLIPIVSEGNRVVALDQRAVVKQDGQIVYSPRSNLDGMLPEMFQWLKDNPQWPPPRKGMR